MYQNVKLLGEINHLIKEKHNLEKNIEIMEGISSTGQMNARSDSAGEMRGTDAEKEL